MITIRGIRFFFFFLRKVQPQMYTGGRPHAYTKRKGLTKNLPPPKRKLAPRVSSKNTQKNSDKRRIYIRN